MQHVTTGIGIATTTVTSAIGVAQCIAFSIAVTFAFVERIGQCQWLTSHSPQAAEANLTAPQTSNGL
jgi:hypothetical protein